MTTETHVVESCTACQVKVRVLKEKVANARCPKCKGLLGDPRVEAPCAGCGAVNRVLRSRMAQARCGRCKEALFAPGAIPRDYLVAEGQALVDQVLADARLASGLTRPRDLVESVDMLKAMPQRIAELAASLAPGQDREQLASLSGRCKAAAETLRPLAFEALRRHPSGFEALKVIRRSDYGPGGARSELAPTASLFERLVDRLHQTDWDDMEADRRARAALAEQLFGELCRAVESWLPRPYKLEAVAKVALTRMKELPGGEEAFAKHEARLREDVTVWLAITTTVVARGVAYHGLGPNAKAVWPALMGAVKA
ncbi:MAG: hypothetical protein ACLGIN_06145 [Candidatus Sericytochromatia bacterium]